MTTHKFIIRKERNNAVMLRLTAHRKSSELGLGISLNPETLEGILNGEVPKGFREQAMKVRHYQIVITSIMDSLTDDEAKSITASEFQKRIKDEIEGIRNPGARKKGDVLPVFKEKIKTSRTPGTSHNYTYTLASVKAFCEDKENPFHKDPELLDFEDITVKWLKAFEDWMTKRGLSANTRWNYLTKLRAIVNKALDEDVISKDPCRRFKIKKEKTRKRSLSVEDLRKLFNYKGTPFQQFHIDMFKLIFMLIGINAADLYGLKSITRNGRIEYRRAKTGTLYSIKVEPEAMEIIDKYKGEKNLINLADRFINPQRYTILTNMMLKKIGSKIDDLEKRSVKEESDLSQISPYWARHTWATIARKIGISKDDIALALGHSTGHDMTDIYIEEDTEPIDIANRRVLDYVLYNQK